jgi:hypothetical protein
MKKYTITTKSGSAFELEAARILANDVILGPLEYNPHNVRPWLIGCEFGMLALAWADCEGDALDIATDAGLLGAFLIDPEDIDPERDEAGEYAYLGNAGEPADLEHAWIEAVPIKKQSADLMRALVAAREEGLDSLADLEAETETETETETKTETKTDI